MKFILGCLLYCPVIALAFTVSLPQNGDGLIGHVQKVILSHQTDIDELSRHYEVGYYEFMESNRGLNINRLRPNTTLIVPREYVLPNVPYRGIVVNLSELRLYYFPPHRHIVMTYPVGIGKEDDPTPQVLTKVIEKEKNPYWKPTPKTRNEFLYNTGMELPEIIDPGKENPLGDYMMRLGNWVYLIHGTNDFRGVGKRTSGGCIRMYPESIAELYHLVPVGTSVNIVHEPIKVGWFKNKLYLESNVPMDVKKYKGPEDLSSIVNLIRPMLYKRRAEIDWDKALRVANEQTGIPTVIGHRI